MKRIFYIIALAVLLGGFLLVFLRLNSCQLVKPTVEKVNHVIVIEKIVDLGKMELVNYQFQDNITHSLEIDWWPDPEVLLTVYGHAVGCVDFQQIDSTALTFVGDSVLIVSLPEPEVCQVKVDHQNSKVQNTSFTSISPDKRNLVDEAYKLAEQEILKAALESGIIENTKQKANEILKPSLEAISQRKVILQFPVPGKPIG